MYWKKVVLSVAGLLLCGTSVWACHRDGPMGFANHNPGAFSVDLTLSPTFSSAGTSGTSGCKNWDYSRHQRLQYLKTQWEFLSEEAAQGKGKHLTAMAHLMGCVSEEQRQFAVLLRKSYSFLFIETKPGNDFLLKLESLLSQDSSLACQNRYKLSISENV